MEKHLIEVLTASGLPAEQVKVLQELKDDAPDFKADTYVAPIRTTVENLVKNDPKFYEGLNKENLPKEFVKQLETEQYGRAAAIVRGNMLKAVGLKEDDFKELGEEGKKIDIFTPAFVKKLSEGRVGDKELQAKLIEANKQLEELTGKMPELEQKYKGEYETKVADFQVSNGVLAHLAQVQGLTVPAKFIINDAVSHLRGKYAFEIVNGSPELRQKDKPTLKVLTDNNTKELTFAGAIDAYLAGEKLVKAKGTKEESSSVEVVADVKGLKISKGVSAKIAARVAEDAKLNGGS